MADYSTEKSAIITRFNENKLNCHDKNAFLQGFVKIVLKHFESKVCLPIFREFRYTYDFRCIFTLEEIQSELEKVFTEIGDELSLNFAVECSTYDRIDIDKSVCKSITVYVTWKQK